MSLSGKINVVNRKGETIPLHLETISNRLDELAAMSPPLSISTNKIASKTADRLIDGIKTSEIDVISAEICSKLIIDDDEFDTLAARIIVSDLHKNTYEDLRRYAKSLESYNYRDRTIKILHPKTIAYILMNHKELNEYIEYKQDYNFNYFGIITLINSYLLAYKFDNNIRIVKERPQQLLLRVAIGIHLDEIDENGHASKGTHESIRETYKLLAYKYYTHATPTLFNAGTINHTLSSCYLLAIDDSLESIYGRLTDIAKISKFSGGVGIHVSQVRAEGSVIGSTIGRSEGLVPMLRVYNESTRYVSQGGGKRKGSTAVYVEPWHADIEACIASQQQQNGGSPEKLCRDLFLALWIPDIFMERLRSSIKSGNTIMWSLMCPDECKGLTDVYGEEFKQLYETYEKQKKYKKQVPIIYLWNLIASSQIETGKPYVMYKDHVNRKSNQSNIGIIKSSNLCSEICIYSDEKNIGVCNLASICLPKFVVTTKDGDHGFDYNKLNQITQRVVYNMNKVIDNNKYPIEQAKYSDDMNRPIGIGVQGLSEVFMMMKQPFDSPIARDVNAKIFETMYYAAMTASNKLAQAFGSYPNFKGSMTSQGIFQFDLWDGVVLSKMWDWDELKHKVKRTGLRNSLLMCIMPTAGTSIITGHTESVEVLKSNFFKRSSLSGNNFQVINKHLVQDLKKLNLWNVTIRNKILENEGSIANIEEIPKKLRDVYKTIYEYKLSAFIEMCADREAFVCQSSSNNRFVSDPSVSKLTKMHLYSWKMGLKTSSYYIHPKQVSTGKKLLKKDSSEEEVCLSCTA